MLFNSAITDFVRFCAVERRLSEHTLQAYACDLADFAKWLPAHTALSDVKPEMLKAYLGALVSDRKLATATVRRRFACLRGFFQRFTDLGQTCDPFAGWRLRLPRRKRLPRALARDEISLLIAALRGTSSDECNENEALCLAVRLMVSTGMRAGELCKLPIDAVSPDCGSVRIHGKGSRDRVTYIADVKLRLELRQFVQVRSRSAAVSSPLFINRHGHRMRPQSIRSKLHKISREAGLARKVTPHMLRHTAATLLIETGVDIRMVQRLLGHSSIATTEIYTHVSDEALRATLERANVLGNLLAVLARSR